LFCLLIKNSVNLAQAADGKCGMSVPVAKCGR